MKDVLKLFEIASIALVTAVIIYPLLHESGHTLAIMLNGGNLYEIHLFPTPCVVSGYDTFEAETICFIGISGILFPPLVALTVKTKRFWLWLIGTVIKCISALSFAISYIAILCYEYGMVWHNED